MATDHNVIIKKQKQKAILGKIISWKNILLIGTWDKEVKDGKEFEPTRGAKFVSGDARITNMANKTVHIFG